MNSKPLRQPDLDIASIHIYYFFALTFGLAWGLFGLFLLAADWVVSTFGELSGSHPLFILAVYAPAIAALGLIAVTTGVAGLRLYLTRLFLWRASPWWYAFLFFGFPLISLLGAAIKGNVASSPMFTESIPTLLPLIGFMLILGPMEEIGWRGFAQPILQRTMTPLLAGLVLGVIWAVWHLPAFVMSGTAQSTWEFLPFFVGSVGCSVILTALFNQARGSILLAMAFHFQMNNPLWPDAQPYDMYLYGLAALAITWVNRDTLLKRETAVTRVIPVRPAS